MISLVFSLVALLAGTSEDFLVLKKNAESNRSSIRGKLYLIRNTDAATEFIHSLLDKCVSNDLYGKSFDVILSIAGDGKIDDIRSLPQAAFTECARKIPVVYSSPPAVPFLVNLQVTFSRQDQ